MLKKSFTLIELVIVIVITSIIYAVTFSNFMKPKLDKNVKVESLKSYLYSLGYQKSVSFICLTSKESCFVMLDDEINKEIENPFGKILSVYSFDQNRDIIYFDDIKIDDENRRVSLYLKMDKYKVHNNLIVETEEKVYVLDSAYATIFSYDSISEYVNERNKIISEVKNVF